MGAALDFTKERTTATISAAQSIQTDWTWQEMSIANMQAALIAITGKPKSAPNANDGVTGQEPATSDAEQTMLGARGDWDTGLDTLHRWDVQGLGMARTRQRDNPANLAVLSGLTAHANSRSGVLDEALAWQSAWAKIDPAWSPTVANTLAAFTALRESCEGPLQKAYVDARTDWRKKSEVLSQMASDLDQVIQALYADATKVFPAGTPNGDMLRSTIPTTYKPPPPPAPAPAPPQAPGK